MNRSTILLLLLVIVGGVARWTYQPEPTPTMPTPIVSPLPLPTTNSGTVATGDIVGTGVVELTGGNAQSGTVDDTELPLDQEASGEDVQVTDPEVEEIIDLLEELISENE